MRAPRAVLGPMLVAGLLAAACGSSESAGPSDPTGSATQTSAPASTSSTASTASTPSTAPTPSTSGSSTSSTSADAPTGDRSDAVVDQLQDTLDSAESSQRAIATNESPVAVFDSFRVRSAGTVTAIHWEGIYCQVVDNAPEPAPTATGFAITVYGDGGDGPGLDDEVAFYAYDISEVTRSLTRTSRQACGPVTSTGAHYRYEAELIDPLRLDESRTYWLSIQALTPNFGTIWGWSGSTSGDGTSRRLADGTMTELDADRAFALYP